jgi:large subunit ribosomal protein L22
VTGPKLNEAPVARHGVRPSPVRAGSHGTKAVARYVRVSPYKVREVLDLIRGQEVERARATLQLTQRDAAFVVAKVLNSAVANADHNDGLSDDELYVSACYCDEGPTLKRWRPRARGRATRIRKRTSHITVLVSRMPDAEIAQRRTSGAAANRAARRAGEQRRRLGRRRPTETVGAAPGELEETTPAADESIQASAAESGIEEKALAEEPTTAETESADLVEEPTAPTEQLIAEQDAEAELAEGAEDADTAAEAEEDEK